MIRRAVASESAKPASRPLANAASSLGLISIIFYGITAAAALRQTRAAGGGELLAGTVLPLFGVLFSLWVLIESLRSGAVSAVILAYGLGSIGLGVIVALLLDHVFTVPFFRKTSGSV